MRHLKSTAPTNTYIKRESVGYIHLFTLEITNIEFINQLQCCIWNILLIISATKQHWTKTDCMRLGLKALILRLSLGSRQKTKICRFDWLLCLIRKKKHINQSIKTIKSTMDLENKMSLKCPRKASHQYGSPPMWEDFSSKCPWIDSCLTPILCAILCLTCGEIFH